MGKGKEAEVVSSHGFANKAWLWAEGVNQEDIEASLQSEIDALKAPTTGTGVPW